MSKPMIQVRGVAKRYHIGVRRQHDNLGEFLVDALKAPLRRIRRFGRSGHTEDECIWALKDIHFDVYEGEVLGLIGANGAGKSTLLKILSRITMPTEGSAVMNGRVGSLLEVGTGFHPELTGRENIFLSGAVLGMKRHEIRQQFDQIVEFAGVHTYLDTPVKRYSSGMRVRLGFAVAAHLQPEILLIDEVLAVGDAEFQAKCLGRMDSIARGGRTVLFVSHNLEAVQDLCARSVYLREGHVEGIGETTEMVRRYLDSTASHNGEVDLQAELAEASVDNAAWFAPRTLRVRENDGVTTDHVRIGRPFSVEVEFEISRPVRGMEMQLQVTDCKGQRIAAIENHDLPDTLEPGSYSACCHVPARLFTKGLIRFGLYVHEARTRDRFVNQNLLTIGVGTLADDPAAWQKIRIRPPCRWELSRRDAQSRQLK